MKDVLDHFSKSANNIGSDSKRLAQMLDKLLKKVDGLGVNSAKASLALRELAKDGSIDIGKIEKLMSPDQLNKLFTVLLKKIKDSPVTLNNKENISLISKAIAKGTRDYASTGFGKMEADFYKNATKKQISELTKIREGLSDKKNDHKLLQLASGLAVGTVGNVGDILMKNAGFGELPGQMADVITSAKKVWDSFKDSKNAKENDRNAMTVEAYKAAEASYAELRRKNEQSRDSLIDAETSKEDMMSELRDSFKEALSRTSFGDKKKNNYMDKLDKGKLDTREINEVINDWKKTLGSAITQDDLDLMKSFYDSTHNGMADIKETEDLIAKSREKYIESLSHENSALVNATKLKEQTDDLMIKEIETKKKEIDKKINKVGKHLSEEMKKSLADNELLKFTNEIREKWGIEDSESKGLFNDNKKRFKNNLIESGMSSIDAKSKIDNDSEISKTLGYNNNLNDRLKNISNVFDVGEITPTRVDRPTAMPHRFNLARVQAKLGRNATPNTPAPVIPQTIQNVAVPTMNVNQPGTNPPANIHQPIANVVVPTANTNNTVPSPKKQQSPRPSGLNSITSNSEYIKKQYDLWLSIFGKDGSKFAELVATKMATKTLNVKISNLPSPPSNPSNNGGTSTTPP